MSNKPKPETTDEMAARAHRRFMPPCKRVFKDHNRYDRKAKHTGSNHD